LDHYHHCVAVEALEKIQINTKKRIEKVVSGDCWNLKNGDAADKTVEDCPVVAVRSDSGKIGVVL
jgi:hypothetical protein